MGGKVQSGNFNHASRARWSRPRAKLPLPRQARAGVVKSQ